MISRYALVRDGVVENVIAWDPVAQPEFEPPSGLDAIPCSTPVGIGWAYDGDDFTEPPREAAGEQPFDQ